MNKSPIIIPKLKLSSWEKKPLKKGWSVTESFQVNYKRDRSIWTYQPDPEDKIPRVIEDYIFPPNIFKESYSSYWVDILIEAHNKHLLNQTKTWGYTQEPYSPYENGFYMFFFGKDDEGFEKACKFALSNPCDV